MRLFSRNIARIAGPNDPAGPSGDGEQPPTRTSRWWVRPLGWVLGVLGLILIGFAAGQLFMPRTVVAPDRAIATEAVDPVVAEEAVVTMPGLLGLTADTVSRVLADAGISTAVKTTTAPAAGPEGVVIAQSPAAGADVIGDVTVTLSEAVLAPELVGLAVAEARDLVESLGAVVQVTREVDPTAADGTVLSSEPTEGQPLGVMVSLVVADAGDALSLSELRFAERAGCRTISQSTLNGTTVQDSILCQPEDDPATADWVLSRRVSALEAVVGVADQGNTGEATVRVLGDGVLLAEARARYGETTDIRVDLRDVLRLRIEVVTVSGEPDVVLGDARLLGTADQLAALEAGQ